MEEFTRIKHLWSRMGFGVGVRNLALVRDGDLSKNIAFLFDHDGDTPIPSPKPRSRDISPSMLSQMSASEKVALRKTDDQILDDFRIAWLNEMISPTAHILREKMALFWHSHLACICRDSVSAASYANGLRKHALGDYRTLLLNCARQPAMIRFLNNQQNRKGSPNENFSRELLELFTMGEGNYSERDIKEAARAFTGWSSSAEGAFVFRERQHDFGEKEFLGHRGSFGGEEIIDLVLEQKATAQHLASRLFHYFVHHEVGQAAVNDLADVLYRSNYNILASLRHMVESDWFYEPAFVGNRIKSPIELLVQLCELYHARFDGNQNLNFLQRSLGQLLFNPPNVAGWPGGRNWINNATLMIRLNLPSYMIKGSRMDHAVSPSLKDERASEPLQFLSVTCDLEPFLSYFRSTPYQKLEDRLKDVLLITESGPTLSRQREWKAPDYLDQLLHRITSLPEFQLG
ncbi:MAG: DUF1800 domain-containing protein [Saprospiraceae bacterium]|nr:DUF1800 domain-containing protein [Saprospiraceae bacterium]